MPTAPSSEPPRILKRPAPLAPAPIDVVPPRRVSPDDPTLVRRMPLGPAPVDTGDHEPLARPAAAPRAAPRPAPVRAAPPAAVAAAAPSAPTAPLASFGAAQASAAPTGAIAPAMKPMTAAGKPFLPTPDVSAPFFTPPGGFPMPEELRTPVPEDDEQAALDLAGAARWVFAGVVDGLLSLGLIAGAIHAGLTARGVRVAVQPVVDFIHAGSPGAIAVLVGAPFVALTLYQALTVRFLGATLGQRLLGLRVVRLRNGAAPGTVRSVVRAAWSSLGVVLFFVGPLWAFWVDRRRRGLGDIVARTIVVRPRSAP